MRLLRGVLLALAFASWAHPASAQQPPSLFGLAHISNESAARATVYYKWGNGPWKKYVIERGQGAAFAWRYDADRKNSPDLFVRIDADTDGQKFVEYKLSRGQSPDDNSSRYGHHFIVKQLKGTDTRYIEGVEQNAKATLTDARSTRP